MNEGFTVFNERKIVARVHGKEQAELYSLLGVAALKGSTLFHFLNSIIGTIDLFGKENQLTQLVPNLDGIDPDDAFSRVPYEKGYNFLRFLEKQVGGPDVFEPFQRKWIQKAIVITFLF